MLLKLLGLLLLPRVDDAAMIMLMLMRMCFSACSAFKHCYSIHRRHHHHQHTPFRKLCASLTPPTPPPASLSLLSRSNMLPLHN